MGQFPIRTPDQDDPDAIGRALGVTYVGEETLKLDEKIGKRDAERWELRPGHSWDATNGRDS